MWNKITKWKMEKITTSNPTWNADELRTYAPLPAETYYKPACAYLIYYSFYYGRCYKDGYGWNFYTQTGNYYDDAPHPDGKTKFANSANLQMVASVACAVTAAMHLY